MGVYEDDSGNQHVSIQLSWTAASPADLDLSEYVVAWSQDNNDWQEMSVERTATSCRVFGLELGESYYFRIKAVDKAGNESAWVNFNAGAIITMPSDTTAPDTPTGLTAYSRFKAVHLGWTNPTQKDLSYITVHRSTDRDTDQDGTHDLVSGGAANDKLAVQFTANSSIDITIISLKLKRTGTPGGNVRVVVYDDAASLPNAAIADGASDWLAASDVGAAMGWEEFVFSTPPSITATSVYHIVLEADGTYTYAAGVDEVTWGIESVGSGGTVEAYGGAAWANVTTEMGTFIVLAELAQIDGDGHTDAIGLWDSTYEYTVQAVDRVGNASVPATIISGNTDITIPSAPTGLSTITDISVDADGHIIPYIDCVWTDSGTEDVQAHEVEVQYDDNATEDGTHDLVSGGAADDKLAAQLTARTTTTISAISLKLQRAGTPGGNVRVVIYDDVAGLPNAAIANGDSDWLAAADVGTSMGWEEFVFSTPPPLTASTIYHLVLEANGGYTYVAGVDEVTWGIKSVVSGGTLETYNGATWSNITTEKGAFVDWWDPLTFRCQGTPLQLTPVPGDVKYRVRVRALDDAANPSAWTAYHPASPDYGTTAKDNVAPQVPANLSIQPGPHLLKISVDTPAEHDWALTEFHVSTTTGFTPSSATLVQSAKSRAYTYETISNVTHYVKVRHRDTSLNWSNYCAQGSGTPQSYYDLVGCDAVADEIHICYGISASVKNSFDAPATHPFGLTYASQNLWSCNSHDPTRIYHHSGLTSTIVTDFAGPSTRVTGLAFDGVNLISCDGSDDKIHKHVGLTSAVATFNSPSTDCTGLTYVDGDLISCDADANKIYRHSGITSTIRENFASPAFAPTGLTFVAGTGELISCDNVADKIYRHAGISVTVSANYTKADLTGLTYVIY